MLFSTFLVSLVALPLGTVMLLVPGDRTRGPARVLTRIALIGLTALV